MTERLFNSLSERIQSLRIQHPPPFLRNLVYTTRHTQSSTLHCVYWGRNNHQSHNCYSCNRSSHFHQSGVSQFVRLSEAQDQYQETRLMIRFISWGHLPRVHRKIHNTLEAILLQAVSIMSKGPLSPCVKTNMTVKTSSLSGAVEYTNH